MAYSEYKLYPFLDGVLHTLNNRTIFRQMLVCLIIYSVIILCILLHHPYNFTPSFFVILKILSIPIILSFKKFRNFPQQHLNNIQPLEEDSSPGEQYLKNKVSKIEVRARGIQTGIRNEDFLLLDFRPSKFVLLRISTEYKIITAIVPDI